MSICAVSLCNNRSKYCSNDIIFHAFPSDKKLAKQWLNLCKRKYIGKGQSLKYRRICSVHFTEDDYKRDLKHELLKLPLRKRRFLSKNGIPSLHLPGKKISPTKVLRVASQ